VVSRWVLLMAMKMGYKLIEREVVEWGTGGRGDGLDGLRPFARLGTLILQATLSPVA
jgi:hypothetical protein